MAKRRDSGRPRGEPIKQAVLVATRAELAEHGIEGLSVERVAARCKLNKTSVYRRWPTREALVAAALEGVLEDVGLTLVIGDNLRDNLLALVTTVARLLSAPEGQALFKAALASSPSSELAELAARQLGKRAASPARTLVMSAIASGQWRKDAKPQLVLSLLVGAVIHRIVLEKAAPSPTWLRAIVELVCDGVTPRPRQKSN